MRAYSVVHPTVPAEGPPDTVLTMLMAAATGQAMDRPSTNANLVRFTIMSTLGVTMGGCVNLVSTHAQPPSSGSSVTTGTTAGSTGNSVPVLGSRLFVIPSYSTGFSVALSAPGYVFAEFWSRG